MSQENRATTSQKNALAASEANMVVEITATTAIKPHGSVRFSRCVKVLEYREKEREERDFIIYLTTPHTHAHMTPACVYVRGVCGYRFSPARVAACPQRPFSERNPMPLPSCFDCRFFCTFDGETRADDLTQSDLHECLQGHCRRNTPMVGHFRGEDQALEYDYGQWPLVLGSNWCGRFEPCERAIRDIAPQTRHVGPRSNISCGVEGCGRARTCRHGAEHQTRQDGEAAAMVPSPPRAS